MQKKYNVASTLSFQDMPTVVSDLVLEPVFLSFPIAPTLGTNPLTLQLEGALNSKLWYV